MSKIIKIAVRMTNNRGMFERIADAVLPKLSSPDSVELIFCSSDEEFSDAGGDVKVAACYKITPEISGSLPGLRWVYIGAAGIDNAIYPELLESDIIVTRASGFHATTTAEFALAMMLFFERRIEKTMRFKETGVWNRPEIAKSSGTLNGKTLGVIGFGKVGTALALMGRACGMYVIATSRSAKAGDIHPDANRILPTNEMDELFSSSDYLAICAPLTEETKGLVDERRLSLMKSTAYLINVARGGLVREEALIEALRSRRIAGAGLDVFSEEPLPPDSPFFGLDNVFLSPHVAGNFSEYTPLAAADFGENLERYMTGKALINVVEKWKGY